MLLLSLGLYAAAQALPLRAGDGDSFCDRARGSFERTGKLARELMATLENLDAEGTPATAGRLAAIRHSFEQEAVVLQGVAPPSGAAEVQTRGMATLGVLMDLTEPWLLDAEGEGRADVAEFVRDGFLAARNEARAAAAALRQSEAGCGPRRGAGTLQLLGRHS